MGKRYLRTWIYTGLRIRMSQLYILNHTGCPNLLTIKFFRAMPQILHVLGHPMMKVVIRNRT